MWNTLVKAAVLRDVADSVRKPDRERTIPTAYGQIRVQKYGAGPDARHYLRLRVGSANDQLQRIEPDQMLALAQALTDIENHNKDAPQ